MKLAPLDDIIGVSIPDVIAMRRRKIARAVAEDDVNTIGEHFREWRAWIVSVENTSIQRVKRDIAPSFSWNCGTSTSARFETACLAYAYARALFHQRQYALAHVHFGLALEETMQCLDPLPLTPNACGAFRLRCLVRAQRLSICEIGLDGDGRRMLKLATWLEVGLLKYATFAGSSRKEPLESGPSLAAMARAVITKHPKHATIAMSWSENPFHFELVEMSRGRRLGSPPDLEIVEGEFDWGRFTSDRIFVD